MPDRRTGRKSESMAAQRRAAPAGQTGSGSAEDNLDRSWSTALVWI